MKNILHIIKLQFIIYIYISKLFTIFFFSNSPFLILRNFFSLAFSFHPKSKFKTANEKKLFPDQTVGNP